MSKFLRTPMLSDLTAIADDMREADRQECRAAAGMSPGLALFLSTQYAEECHTMVAPDGEPVGLCGLTAGQSPEDKQVWMLGTNGLLKHKHTFLTESRKWFEDRARRFILWNYVDSRNAVHIRWLKWLGVQFIGSKTSPFTGTELLLFTKVTPCA